MKVRLTVELFENNRRAINNRVGRKGLATHAQCKTFLMGNLLADLEALEADEDLEPSADTRRSAKGE